MRTLEIIANQLREEISKGPVLQSELARLNDTANRLQDAEESQLRAERDEARACVAELEVEVQELRQQLSAVNQKGISNRGPAAIVGVIGDDDLGDEDEEGLTIDYLGGAATESSGGTGEEGMARRQCLMARHQQLLDQRLALQQERRDLKVSCERVR